MSDVVIIGAGPAGLCLAVALAERGVEVCVVDSAADAPWPATYGIWLDEAEAYDLGWGIRRTWSRPLAGVGPDFQQLDRTYAVLDNRAVQQRWTERLHTANGKVKRARVASLLPDDLGHVVVLDDGTQLECSIVVDASGRGYFLERPAGSVAYQTAIGWLAEVEGLPWSEDEMVLMDYRPTASGAPTFLYALPLGDGRVLLEETVLAASPAVPVEALEASLAERLSTLGVTVKRVHEREWVSIPMNAPLPAPQRVVGFGAAAGFVHPATGYSLGRTLATAPRLADRLAATRGQSPDRRARQAWAAVWTPGDRSAHQLASLGLDVVLSLEPHQVGPWMHGFFEMPRDWWATYLSATSSVTSRFAAMCRLGPHLTGELLRHAARVTLGSSTRMLQRPG